MVKHFEEWFSKNSLQPVFKLLESYQIHNAKLECDQIYRQQRILLQAISTDTAAVFGPIQYLRLYKVCLIIDDRVSNEHIYLNLVRDLLNMIRQQIVTSQQFEILEVRTISGKTTGALGRDLEIEELIEKIKACLFGAFDKTQIYWTDRVNESINFAYEEVRFEFETIWILENSELGALKSSEIREFAINVKSDQNQDPNIDASNLNTNSALARIHQNSNQIMYSCYNCSNQSIQNSQNSLYYHEFNVKTGTFKSDLVDRLLDLGSELRQLAKYISRLELEVSNTQNVVISEEINNSRTENSEVSIPDRPFLPLSSECWLQKYGLKPCGLTLTKFLKPKTVSKVTKTYVPSLGKKIESKVLNESNLIQFEGKNLSLTKKDTGVYKADLSVFQTALRQRIKWLADGSRAVFGVVTSERVILLVDVSSENHIYLDFLKANFVGFANEQLTRCREFNVVCCSGDTWRLGFGK